MNSKKVLFAVLAIFVAWLCITSCKSTKPLVSNSDSVSKTTLILERDTNVVAPADSASLTFSVADLIKASNATVSTSKAGNTVVEYASNSKQAVVLGTVRSRQASIIATLKNGQLQVGCKCDTLAIIAKIKDKYQSKERTITKTITLPPVQIKYIPWYVTALAWVGGIGILALVIMWLIGRYLPKKP
jgi:predicted component of type VI protein secretion system